MSTPATTTSDYTSDPASDPMIGRSLDGRYTILGRLGKGSMGTVYRARQTVMDRDVAIKVLRQDRALDESSKARFFREARATSVLHSPHTVTVFDFGQTADGDLYLAMQILDGESLGQRLTRIKRFPVDEAIDATRQVLRSLAEAHAKGIIHRDLKPDNIFFARVVQGASTGGADRHDEIVKVLDFGIAKLTTPDGAAVPGVSAVETQAGTVFGTPRYMSPEQAQGKPLDHRTDLYSLGVMLYQMLTGRPPFTDTDAVVVMARHIRTPPKSPREVAPDLVISDPLEALVMKALSKDARERPASAEAMSAALAEARDSVLPTTSGMRRSARALSEPPPSATDSQPTTDTLESSAYDAVDARRRTTRWVGLGIIAAVLASVAVVGMAHPFRTHADPLVVTGPTSTSELAVTSATSATSGGAVDPQAVPTPTMTTPTAGAWVTVTDAGVVAASAASDPSDPPLAPVVELPTVDPAQSLSSPSSAHDTRGARGSHRHPHPTPGATANGATKPVSPPPGPTAPAASSGGYGLFE